MKTGKALLGILTGVAVGAAVGILFAPDEGKKTRKKIRNKGRHLADDIKYKYDDVVTSASKKLDEIKAVASKFAHQNGVK